MLRTTTSRWIFQWLPDGRIGWMAWGLFFLAVALLIVGGSTRSVTGPYAMASRHWLEGTNLYTSDGRGFLYLPHAAILYIPLSLLPRVPSEIAWRAITIGLFAAGTFQMCRPLERPGQPKLFTLVTLVTIPLAASAGRNGQTTLAIAGLMLLSIDRLLVERWWQATAMLCLAVALKPLALALALLVAALWARMLWRLALGFVVLALIPFAIQDAGYVAAQYRAFATMLQAASHLGIERPWAHLFGMLQCFGIDVPASMQSAVRIFCALGTLALAGLARRTLPAERCGVYLYALAASYLMLLNPRTENNTYAMVAPAIGIFCGMAYRDRHFGRSALYALCAAGIVGSYAAGKALAPEIRPVWLAPLACSGFTLALVASLLAEVAHAAAPQWTVWPARLLPKRGSYRAACPTESPATSPTTPRLA